jgi:hypothetical protein
MTDPWLDRLSEYLDDELTPADRLAIERHLLDCTHCREVLDELRGVTEEARALQDDAPARDLWPGIVKALPGRAGRSWRLTLSLPQTLAASVLLMLVSGLAVWLFIERSRTAVVFEDAIAARPAVVSASFTDPKYDRAVADLARVLQDGRGRLNPRTVAVLERNLATIDRAIAEARGALERDPGDPFLNSHLAEQRQRKLALLREAKNLVRSGL